MGKEQYAVPVVNDVDEENYPVDFRYVMENVETTPMNVNRTITSLQHCDCRDDCASLFCRCTRSSVQCWYDKVRVRYCFPEKRQEETGFSRCPKMDKLTFRDLWSGKDL